MKYKNFILSLGLCFVADIALADNEQLQQQIKQLQQQTIAMQAQLAALQKQLVQQANAKAHAPSRMKEHLTHSAHMPHHITPAPNSLVVSKANHQVKYAPKSMHKACKTVKHGVIYTQTSYHNLTQPQVIRINNLEQEQRIKVPMRAPVADKNGHQQYTTSLVSVHTIDADPESVAFYPTALVAKDRVLTYIAGTPVVTSPYLGSRPAFDGSDYIVNISSINRDIRLMQQRRSLNRAYKLMGYPLPNRPILALSGKVEPIGTLGQPYFGETRGDWNLGSDELDVAAILNDKVEAYMGLAYNAAPPAGGGQRVANSNLSLNMGFINIGDLDCSPFYGTAGQLFAPFGRFSTSMVSPTLPMLLARTKARPVILGYKSQSSTGPFAALYGYRGDTTLGSTGVGGVNLGYIIDAFKSTSEFGISYISSLDDAGGMQYTGSQPGTTFGGFASQTNGSEFVHKVGGIGAHATISFDRYNITAEWVSSLGRFHESDLSFNGFGAQPQALQLEGAVTFISFTRPSSIAGAYQWSKDTLALNLPQHRINVVYNISIWKDTVESLEYRHDIDFNQYQYANGAAPTGMTNANTYGTGGTADAVLAQIGIYF